MNIAKLLAEYIKSKITCKEVYYSSLPPGDEAVCIYEYDSQKPQNASLPGITLVAFKIVCRTKEYNTCHALSQETANLLKNTGNELWGSKPLLLDECEFILISPRGTPDIKRETESGNIRIAAHFHAWVRKRREAA